MTKVQDKPQQQGSLKVCEVIDRTQPLLYIKMLIKTKYVTFIDKINVFTINKAQNKCFAQGTQIFQNGSIQQGIHHQHIVSMYGGKDSQKHLWKEAFMCRIMQPKKCTCPASIRASIAHAVFTKWAFLPSRLI